MNSSDLSGRRALKIRCVEDNPYFIKVLNAEYVRGVSMISAFEIREISQFLIVHQNTTSSNLSNSGAFDWGNYLPPWISFVHFMHNNFAQRKSNFMNQSDILYFKKQILEKIDFEFEILLLLLFKKKSSLGMDFELNMLIWFASISRSQ